MQRTFLPWELNHLRKYGFSDSNLDQYGTTPVEYITGHTLFRNSDFLVDPSVLIPRIETEELVDLALNFILKNHTPDKTIEITDVACGSGVIGISLALSLEKHQFYQYHLTFSDISDSALTITKQNITNLIPHLQSKISVLKSDLLLSYPDKKIDCLISNLPYIPTDTIRALDPSVKDHEPLLALDGGQTGTSLINRLLSQTPKLMSPSSSLFLEIDSSHQLSDFQIPLFYKADLKKDEFNQPRYLILTSLSNAH